MKKNASSLLIVICLFLFYKGNAQERPNFHQITERLDFYTTQKSPEKTYIHTDKDFYANGETIWYKTYLLDGITHRKTTKSNLIYVEFLDPNDSILVQQKLLPKNLGAHGDIQIPQNTKQGTYTLRAYSKYMFNEEAPIYHSKKIPVWQYDNNNYKPLEDLEKEQSQELALSKDFEPTIKFYPEGGNLVTDIQSTLGIKAMTPEGKGIKLQGKIVDQKGNMVSLFKTFDYGLGTVTYVPRTGKIYTAIVSVNGVDKKFELPVSKKLGYTLSIQNNKEYILIKAKTNKPNGLKNSLLLGHLRGNTIINQIETGNKTAYSLKLLTSDLADGVANFTLFTAEGEPVCERLVFIDNPENDVKLNTTIKNTEPAQRQKVAIAINVKDMMEKPLSGYVSASIVTSTNRFKREGSSIQSWLLLNSDIGGTVPNANFFFQEKSPAKKYLLDALMLTHGWRRFVWKDLLNNQTLNNHTIKPEDGITISGTTTKVNDTLEPKPAFVSLITFYPKIYTEKIASDTLGNFNFKPLVFYDTIKVSLQAKPIKKAFREKKNEIAITANPFFPEIVSKNKLNFSNENIDLVSTKEYLKQSYKKRISDFKYDPEVKQLEMVTVEAKRKTAKEILDEKIRKLTLYGTSNNRIFPDSIPAMGSASVFDLLRRIAGVQVFGNPPNQTVQIRGAGFGSTANTSPLFLLDGIQTDAIFIQNMLANEVSFIDVLKGPEGAIFGSNGSNGVVAIYTKNFLGIYPEKNKKPTNILHLKVPGYTKAKEFYSPNYSIPKPLHKREDYRTTLHWEPNVKINTNGNSKLEFYTGDTTGRYIVKLEGITTDGRPFTAFKNFEVLE